MDVIYTDRAKENPKVYDLLLEATKWLQEGNGPSAAHAKAVWDRTEDESGQPIYTLRVSHGGDSAQAAFSLQDLNSSLLPVDVTLLWGKVLQTRQHRQQKELLAADGVES